MRSFSYGSFEVVCRVPGGDNGIKGECLAISASLDRGESGEEIQALGGWTHKDSSGLELGA